MVILDVKPDGRDSYKIWEEGQVPSAIFEMSVVMGSPLRLLQHKFGNEGIMRSKMSDPPKL